MDLTGIAAIITALVAAISAIVTALVALWRLASERGKKDAIAEQAQKTLAAKEREIAELREDNTMLESWVESLTRPPEKSP
jgi:cell division protein FtsB